MPFLSKAQMKKFAEMVKQGTMKQSTFDQWNRETDHKKLPERISDHKPVKSIREMRDIALKKGKR